MNLESLRSALHVVRCPSAGGILNQTLHLHRDRRLLVGEDPLSWGPAPATDDLDLWRATRESFLDAVYRANGMEFSFDGYADIGLLMNVARLCDEQEIIVWAGTGLEDQLFVAWTVFLCDRLNVDVSKLRVIQFEMVKSSRRIGSMGEVGPEIIRSECPAPRPVSPIEAEELRRAWRAYTSGDPASLADYVAEKGPLPLLHDAMTMLLLRYPDHRTGLGSIDERILRAVVDSGPRTFRVTANASQKTTQPIGNSPTISSTACSAWPI